MSTKTHAYVVSSAASVATPKPAEQNQDRACAFSTSTGAAAALCDGVGSYRDSGVVAEQCLAVAVEHIETLGVGVGVVGCADAVSEFAVDLRESYEGATTLIAVGAETGGAMYFTMVGNGAIYAIEAVDASHERAELYSANLVVPHIGYGDGQLALRSFLPAPSLPVERSAGALFAPRKRAVLLLGCSDGISTAEDCPIGRTSNGDVWQHVAPPLAAVLDILAIRWTDLLAQDDGGILLGEVFSNTLDGLLSGGRLEDDATLVGVLVKPRGDELGPVAIG